MKNDRCPVCRGSKHIRLPLYHPVSIGGGRPFLEESSREYACPECCGVPESRVKILGCSASVDDRYAGEDGYRQAIRHQFARQMAEQFLEEGFIDVQFSAAGDDGRAEAMATLGVVSPKVVASMQERISEHQEVMAREVARAAAAGIRVWNSHYTGDDGSISKAQAIDAVYEALKAVTEKRRNLTASSSADG